MTTPSNSATPDPVDQPFRRLFAGFDRDVEPPADLATRLRLRVLAEAELDDPIARRPVPAPVQAADVMPAAIPRSLQPAPDPRSSDPVPRSSLLAPKSRTDEAGARRRQPWYLVAGGVAAGLILLMGAAAVALRLAGEPDRSVPRLGSSITAVASPSSEPQLLWERTDPDLQGTGDIADGDDLIVRSVVDEHRSGLLWFERYDYTSYLQALDRRTGELRWQIPVDGYGTTYDTAAAVLYISYPNEEAKATSLTALSHADGTELWRTELAAPPAYVADDLAVRDNLVYLTTYDAHVRAYDLRTGAEVWATAIGDPPGGDPTRFGPAYVSASSPTLDGDRLITLDPTGAVVELDAATGAVVTTDPVSVTLPRTIYEGRLIVTADHLVTVVTGTNEETIDGQTSDARPPLAVLRISATDRATGEPAWATDLEGNLGMVTEADGRLVVWLYDETPPADGESAPTVTGTIRMLDVATGAEVWSIPQPAGYPLVSHDEATTSDGQLLIGDQTGEVVSLDLATGSELWRYPVGDLLQMPPTVTGGLAIVSDRPDHLVAVSIPERDRP